MTNQEAIDALQDMIDSVSSACVEQEWIDAIPLAITALEKQESIQIRKFGDGTSKCPICRNWLKEDMDFCDKCGQAVKMEGEYEYNIEFD